MVNGNAILSAENVSLSVGAFALEDISFEVAAGEYFVLLGPTGCGKTLLAETVCGLNYPQSGRIRLAGRDVTHVDPSRRKIGYVPQDYGLLPFKSVEDNIAFGLQAQRLPRGEISDRVDQVLDMLDIDHLRKRRPVRLSGGERQRVALGRALAIRPDVLVLDEPLSALDESTSEEMMQKLRELHRNLNTTFLHICHRLEEAFTLATMLGVMRDGRIERLGTPDDLLSDPRSLFVAQFLRLPGMVKGEIIDTINGRAFCVGNIHVSETDEPPRPAHAMIPMYELSVSLTEPEAAPEFAVLAETIAENRTRMIQPGLKLNGLLNIIIPGIFPRGVWAEGRKVFIRIPKGSVRVLPDDE